MCRCKYKLKFADFSPESISRNFTLCPPMETSQRHQTRRWCTSTTSPFFDGIRFICNRVSRLLPPRTESSRRLGCRPRIGQVRVSVQMSRNPAYLFFLSWIYAQFIAIDANFRLKLKNRQLNDPELGSGWFYFVENSAYTSHVEKSLIEEEVRCIPNDTNVFL